jgi:pimeloyl-ACP methyl ester carboxylesterase
MRFDEVTFRNGEAQLAATLVIPGGEGPHPAVALVEGSGTGVRQDPYFLALVDLFGSIGFATLAWDKPGCGQSTGDWLDQDLQARAHEAIAAVSYLKSRSDIHSGIVGLWGISQGGWVAPLAASLSGEIAFVIAVSGPAVSPADQELYRVEHELRADGFSPEDVETAVAFYSAGLQLLRDGLSFEAIMQAIGADGLQDPPWLSYVSNLDPRQAEFMRRIMDHDPRSALRNLTCPFLGIWGENDRLVPALLSVDLFRQDLIAAGNPDFTLKVFAEADHGIYTSETGSRKEAAARRELGERHFAPGYFQLMKSWLSERFVAPVGALSSQQ